MDRNQDHKEPTLLEELERLINSHSLENQSNTPDFILAGYLKLCLDAFNLATHRRTEWYNPPEET